MLPAMSPMWPQCCPNVAPMLPQGCPMFPPMLPQRCPNVAKMLPQCGPNVAPMLPKCCPNVAPMLPQRWLNVTPMLPLWGPNVATKRWEYPLCRASTDKKSKIEQKHEKLESSMQWECLRPNVATRWLQNPRGDQSCYSATVGG